jgi:hypothetical protein
MVMLGGASLFLLVICAVPHIQVMMPTLRQAELKERSDHASGLQDRHPPRVSALRIGQCSFALSTINIMLASLPNLIQKPMALLANASAVVAAILCVLHSTAGIIRGLKRKRRAEGQMTRSDSLYGASRHHRTLKDSVLLCFIVLSAVGQCLTYEHGRSVASISMVVGLGCLFLYKPLRALHEGKKQLLQVPRIRGVIESVWPGKKGAREGENEEEDEVFDEARLVAKSTPHELAAEVVQLRRKMLELEDRLAGGTGR